MKIPATPPDVNNVAASIRGDQSKLLALYYPENSARGGAYDHWEKVRFRPPVAPLTTPEEMWAALKFARSRVRRELPFRDKNGQQIHYSQIAEFQQALHEIDSNARGMIAMPGQAATSETRDLYLQKSLIEEPFSSSVLEGAATTRAIARKMIEEGRKPKTLDERMVLDNYRAMSFIREHRHEPLSVARILEIHRILTEDTLDRPDRVGVLRAPEDPVRVEGAEGQTLHWPPAADELPRRLDALCEFANAPSSGKDGFLHPVIRAIVLHYMLAYDHPFWDGNGRCARALFYWCVLKHGYWLLEYVSISAVILRAPVKYGMAFLYSETDAGDVTYFIEHQLGVIERSVADLQEYLVAKSAELSELGRALGKLERQVNRRQLAIIQDALKHDGARYTIAEHERLNHVSYLTARADLEDLASRGLLRKTKQGTKSVFLVPKDLKARLAR